MHSAATKASRHEQPTDTNAPRRKVRRRPSHTALDARSWQFKLLQATKAELLAHVGPSPSITQRALAERAAWLTVYVAEMDAKAKAGDFMTDQASRQYLAWSNALARTLARLGPQAKAAKPDLASYLANKAQRAEQAA